MAIFWPGRYLHRNCHTRQVCDRPSLKQAGRYQRL